MIRSVWLAWFRTWDMKSYRLQSCQFLCGLGFWSHEVQKGHIQTCLENACMFYYHLGEMGGVFHLGSKSTFCTRKVFVFLK